MRKLSFTIFLVCFFAIANSQNLTVEGTSPDLYVAHTVAPKENFYSVGRLYNQAPKTIAAFNSITMEKGLTIGQQIKIPLTDQNFDVSGSAGAGETLIPITHIVVKSETLTKIGADYKVSPQMVKKWNSLSSDNITPGVPLIVGNLKVKSSDQAQNARPNAPASIEAPVTKTQPTAESKTPAVASTTVKATENKAVAEPARSIVPPTKDERTTTTKPVDTALAISAQVAKQNVPASVPTIISAPKEESVKEKKETAGYQQDNRLAGNSANRQIDVSSMETGSVSQGAFSALFANNPMQRSLKNKNGEAATFKSTSGWQDKKYYVLMDNVAPGTILKISAADKVVYAKVLGNMPEMKENNGLLLRISNSAASSLGIIDPKFPVEVSFYQ